MGLDVDVSLSRSSTPRLSRAILLYEDTRAQQAFATLHHVRDGAQGEPELGPGELLTSSMARELSDALNHTSGVSFLPPGTLVSAPGVLVWFEPAKPRRLWFRTGDPFLDSISGTELPQPPLVFVAKDDSLRVFALENDERPLPDTPLLRAPYYNVFSNQMVCLGSTVLPGTLQPEDQGAYSEGFFRSAFTHPNGTPPIQQWAGSYGEFWRYVQELGFFPTQNLPSANTTLQEVLRDA